jgi:hypothetical protein
LIGFEPGCVAQEAVDFVGYHELLVGNIASIEAPGEIDRLAFCAEASSEA